MPFLSWFGSSFKICSSTFCNKSLSGEINIDCAKTSCSAWENKSATIHEIFAFESAIIRISDGPAKLSIPTSPYNSFLASATY